MRRFIAVGCAVLVSGCVYTRSNFAAFSDSHYTPTESAVSIKVLDQIPARRYEVLGIVRVVGNSNANLEAIVSELKEKAASVGGQAIIEFKTDTQVLDVDLGVTRGFVATAKVIRFVD